MCGLSRSLTHFNIDILLDVAKLSRYVKVPLSKILNFCILSSFIIFLRFAAACWTTNKKFAYWFSSYYATWEFYFQFCVFQYQNTCKLKLNIKIKCSYFDIEIRKIENRILMLRNSWKTSKQTFYWLKIRLFENSRYLLLWVTLLATFSDLNSYLASNLKNIALMISK